MEGQLNFELKLSLEETVLRRMVVNLWSEAATLASIEDLRFELLPNNEGGLDFHKNIEEKVRESVQWRETIESVKAKVSELALPKPLKQRMVQVVRPIGSEILRWRLLFREAHLSDSREDSLMHLQQLCWTSAGTVDCKRTAERLIRLPTVDVVERYKLACWYCLEKDIPVLWKELPEEYRAGIKDRLDLLSMEANPVNVYWAEVLLEYIYGTDYNPLNIGKFSFRRAFECSTLHGNRAAAEYFLQKLTSEERNSSLVKAAGEVLTDGIRSTYRCSFPKEMYSDLFFYLFSEMTPEQKVKVFQEEKPDGIFAFLLDWPWQDLLLDSVDGLYSLLERSHRSNAISYIYKRHKEGFCFPKLLQDFYFRCPVDFRNRFVFFLIDALFSGYASYPDLDTVKEIFRNTNFAPGELASGFAFESLLVTLMTRDKWDVVEVCLRETSLRCDSLRRMFEGGSYSESMLRGTGRIERFFELLDEIEASANVGKGSELDS